MMRYFIVLSYRGTAYHGWQIQLNAYTVQQAVQEALSCLLGQPVTVTGSGRTDTGVHAWQQIAHFDWDRPLPADFSFRLNAVLPADISVGHLYEVAPTRTLASVPVRAVTYTSCTPSRTRLPRIAATTFASHCGWT